METFLPVILVLPLLGAIMNALLGRRIPRKVSELLSSGVVGLSLLSSILIFFWFISLPADARSYHLILWRWISVGEFQPSFGLQLDPLSMVMTLLITGIGFLVHIYSVGFMRRDDDYSRYFSYLNLFIFFMLIIVLADNLLMLLLGWEGVGLCSYLLIGFWYDVEANARAGRKAFIATRIGDLGLISAILMIFNSFGSLDYRTILPKAQTLEIDGPLAILITLLILCGALGKSAQLPLQVWLPDAMRGPTPVSALIHSATMVTAGVYLITRLNPFYQMAPATNAVISAIGILTALYGASSALAQRDIKRVLAYSTISQLGLMFLAIGIGAYRSAIFHLMSQAFFKSLLFLVAGCLIAATGEHEIFRIRIRSPILYWTFLAGALSLAAIPGTSGFFSKDVILLASYASGNPVYWAIVLFTSYLTSLYIFRVFFVVFYKSLREAEAPPLTMMAPLLILSFSAIFWGYTGGVFDRFLEPLLPSGVISTGGIIEISLMVIATILTLAGIYTAYTLYVLKRNILDGLVGRWQRVYRILQEGYSFDKFYEIILVNPYYHCCSYLWTILDAGLIDNTIDRMGISYRRLTYLLWRWIDIGIVDGIVNGIAGMTLTSSRVIRTVQTGLIRDYAIPMVGGVILLFLYYLWIMTYGSGDKP